MLLKPAPDNVVELYEQSLVAMGIDLRRHVVWVLGDQLQGEPDLVRLFRREGGRAHPRMKGANQLAA